MIWSFCVLIGCQVLGDVLHILTGLPIPGTVFGIALLLLVLCGWGKAAPVSLPAGDALLPYLGLFFVPPGVSALLRLSQFTHALFAIAAAIVVSSVVTLAVAGRIAQLLLSRDRKSPAIRAGTSDVRSSGQAS